MRKTLVAASAVVALGLMGCQQDEPAAEKAVDVETLTDEQKQTYAMGASMAIFVQNRAEEMESLGAALDKDLVAQGFADTLAARSTWTMDDIRQYAQAGEQKMRELQVKSKELAAAANIEAGKKFLEENGKKEDVITTESGLQYTVINEGEGESPTAIDKVTVHYHGTLLDGTTFDSSYDRGQPATFGLNQVISGWTEGVQLMQKGAKYRFFIPSELAYGQRATGAITPHSTLIFDVELLDIAKTQTSTEE